MIGLSIMQPISNYNYSNSNNKNRRVEKVSETSTNTKFSEHMEKQLKK